MGHAFVTIIAAIPALATWHKPTALASAPSDASAASVASNRPMTAAPPCASNCAPARRKPGSDLTRATITVRNIGQELLNGPRADRTRVRSKKAGAKAVLACPITSFGMAPAVASKSASMATTRKR